METETRNVNQTTVGVAATAKAEAAISEEALSALGYFCGIIAVLALVLEPYKNSAKVRLNAIQSLLFGGAWVVGYLTISIVGAVVGTVISLTLGALKLYALSAILLGIFPVVTGLFTLAMVATWIYLIVAAATGKTPRLPVLHAYAVKFAK